MEGEAAGEKSCGWFSVGKTVMAVKGGSLRLKVEDQRKGGCAAPFVLWFWPGEGRVRENGEALWAVAALVSVLA